MFLLLEINKICYLTFNIRPYIPCTSLLITFPSPFPYLPIPDEKLPGLNPKATLPSSMQTVIEGDRHILRLGRTLCQRRKKSVKTFRLPFDSQCF